MIKVSEVNIQFIKPVDGLIGFASLVINDEFYLGSIGVHQKLKGPGFRFTYPTKKGQLSDRPVFHPISKGAAEVVEQAICKKLEDVMRKYLAGHTCNDIGW